MTHETAKVVGSNLDQEIFFQTGKNFFPKKCGPVVYLLMFCRLSCLIVKMILVAHLFKKIYAVFNFTSRDFV